MPIWGHAAPGEHVTVRFAGQEARATADAAGQWRVTLAPLAATGTPSDLTVSAANTVTVHDVLVGEVWLCSGQSNMEMAIGVTTAGARPEAAHDPALAEETKTANYPAIRLLRVEKKLSPPEIVTAGWLECRGDALARFSAIGFFFGRDLHAALGVPVGIIESAWGGSRIEEWTPAADYARVRPMLGEDAERCFERDPRLVGRNYEAMIAPLATFALRGVLWYQGESNIIAYNDGGHYADKFAVMVEVWRRAWSRSDLPFYSVQLAPFTYTHRKDRLVHADDELPKLWAAQEATTAIPHTGLVPIADTVTDVRNIHPGGKAIVAQRLTDLALTETYGRNDRPIGGPLFQSAEFRDGKAVVRFMNAEGLRTHDGRAPTDFEVAGSDGQFVPGTATIAGNSVVVASPRVPSPSAVRFGWHETACPNLENKAGWPAYPFRSDTPARR